MKAKIDFEIFSIEEGKFLGYFKLPKRPLGERPNLKTRSRS